jgi:signal transduction histidine kinase
VIRVCDNGLGVPADKRQKLFGEFFRAHDDTITDADGTGLGLSIVRETVESAGGRAWAEFPDGLEAGSIFAFALPSRREDDAAAANSTN